MSRNVIGHGGFGTVIKQQINGRTVAVKCLSSGDHPRSLRREVNILKELTHPNVVEYIDVYHSEEGTLVNIVTEYCERGDVKNFIKNTEKCYSISTVIDWASQLFDALTYLQERRVFHRDIKPSNILLGHHYEMKLCDFGLSKVEASEYSGYGVVGTLRYTPPEALGYIEGQHLFTHASDLYAAGLVLWETVERRQVYSGPKAIHATLVFRICYGDPLERPKCRDLLADLISRCCSRELEKRPTSSEALSEILKMKEERFYELFLMKPSDDPSCQETKSPFGAVDDSDLFAILSTIKPQTPKEKAPVTNVASVVLGKTKFEQLQQVFNGNPLRRSTSAEELPYKRLDLKPLSQKSPLGSPLEEDEEVTPTPMSLSNSNKEDQTMIAKKQNVSQPKDEMENGEGKEQRRQPFMNELKAAFVQRYINFEKLSEFESANFEPKPGTSKDSQKSEDDSGFLEKSSEFEPRLTPIRLAPSPPIRAPSPSPVNVGPFSPPALPPKLGWNVEMYPKLRNKIPFDDAGARDRLLHRRSLPNTEWKPPVPPRRTASPALPQKGLLLGDIPEPPLRKLSLQRSGWVSDELLTIWCKNLVIQHPTWSADLLKRGISHIVDEKSETKMESFMARVLRNEATMPSGPGFQLACVVRLELGIPDPYPFLKGFDLFFRNFLRKCDFFTVSKGRYKEALEFCFHILMRDDAIEHNVYQEVVMLLLAFDLAQLKEWANPMICNLLRTNREFLSCEVAKQLLIRSEEMPNEMHKRWLREEANSLAEGPTLDQRLFVLRAFP